MMDLVNNLTEADSQVNGGGGGFNLPAPDN